MTQYELECNFQEQNKIPENQRCTTCRFFKPNVKIQIVGNEYFKEECSQPELFSELWCSNWEAVKDE